MAGEPSPACAQYHVAGISDGMHIGFDISQTGSRRAGCGFFAHAMAGALLELAPDNRYSLFPSFGDFYFDPLMPLRSRWRGGGVRYGPRHLTRDAAASFWNRRDLERRTGFPDVVHSNNYWCPLQLDSARLVYTCYDLGFTVDPDWTTEENRTGCFEGVFRASIAADWVVAISEASRRDYLALFPYFPEERIRVIHPCSRFDDASAPGRRVDSLAPGAFWLNVGTVEPRKNQLGLAKAYARYRALGGAPLPLVIAGGRGWRMEGFERELHALGISEHVVFTGYVSDEQLAWLYRHCLAHLYPSFFEGFGLPVLEGMQFGAPTVVSDTSSLPEVAGEAAVRLAPDDVEGWARAMLRLASDAGERERLRRAGHARAAAFDRAGSARALLALYEEAITQPKRFAPLAAA